MRELIRIKSINIYTLALTFLLGSNCYAKCSKEDIDYYLEKKFTKEQITAMCSEDIISSRDFESKVYKSFSEEYADEEDEEYIRRMRIERQAFLKSAINAQKIQIRKTILSYQTEKCGRNAIKKSGEAEGSNIEGCSTVKTEIDLANIEVSNKKYREKILFGTKQIYITGNIKHRIVGGLDHLSSFEKKMLEPMILKKLKQGEARIPIRSGLDFDYAVENFTDLVNFHKGIVSVTNVQKDLGGELNFDESKDTKNYIIEEEKKGLKLSNDKDEEIIDGTLVFDDLDSVDNNSLIIENDIPEDVFN